MSCEPVKGSSASAEDDVWDDTLLIKAYDNSLKLVKEQLARRIAESTNSKSLEKGKQSDDENDQPTVSKESTEVEFKVGDYVRATYEDGIDYEAKIISMDRDQGMCVVKYIGYDNDDEVRIVDLVPSWGKKTRRSQFAQAKPIEVQADTAKEPKKNKFKHAVQANGLPMGSVPPPPPMPPMLNELTEDSEHLSAMLMSWYMSGYYTGIYQGMRMQKTRQNKK